MLELIFYSELIDCIFFKIVCDQVCRGLVTGQWFSPGPLVYSTNKTDRHDITETLLNVALNTIKHTKNKIVNFVKI